MATNDDKNLFTNNRPAAQTAKADPVPKPEDIKSSGQSAPPPAPAFGNTAVPGTPPAIYTEPQEDWSNETTIIAKGTKIVGDIETGGNLQIDGNVKGNVIAGASLQLNGRVIGDIRAQDIDIVGSAIKGNIAAKSNINIDKNTTIVGNVTADEGSFDGRIKGNLTIKQRAHLDKDAVLVGNLVAGIVNIEDGAMLKGDVTISHGSGAQVQVDEPDFDIAINSPGGAPENAATPASPSSAASPFKKV